MAAEFFKPCRKEFQLRNCGFEDTPPEEIVKSQWQSRTKNVYYLLYRWAVAIFFFGAVIDSMSKLASLLGFGMYMIFLTNWGIILCLITTLYGAVLVTKWYFHPQFADEICQSNEMPRSFKAYWCLHNATLTISIAITIIYWGVLHNEKMTVDSVNVLTHACNSVFMFLDVLIVAYPVRMYHAIQPICFGIIYVIFSWIYYLCGGTDPFGNHYIYFVLDWENPGLSFMTIFGTIILAIVLQSILYLVYRLRVLTHSRCCKKTVIYPTTTPTVPESQISMVLGKYGYNNEAFKGSTDKI